MVLSSFGPTTAVDQVELVEHQHLAVALDRAAAGPLDDLIGLRHADRRAHPLDDQQVRDAPRPAPARRARSGSGRPSLSERGRERPGQRPLARAPRPHEQVGVHGCAGRGLQLGDAPRLADHVAPDVDRRTAGRASHRRGLAAPRTAVAYGVGHHRRPAGAPSTTTQPIGVGRGQLPEARRRPAGGTSRRPARTGRDPHPAGPRPARRADRCSTSRSGQESSVAQRDSERTSSSTSPRP